jgi:hypothetical protein
MLFLLPGYRLMDYSFARNATVTRLLENQMAWYVLAQVVELHWTEREEKVLLLLLCLSRVQICQLYQVCSLHSDLNNLQMAVYFHFDPVHHSLYEAVAEEVDQVV